MTGRARHKAVLTPGSKTSLDQQQQHRAQLWEVYLKSRGRCLLSFRLSTQNETHSKLLWRTCTRRWRSRRCPSCQNPLEHMMDKVMNPNPPTTEDASLSFQTCLDATMTEDPQCRPGPIWTPPARLFIEAFTRTVASAHPSLVSVPDRHGRHCGSLLATSPGPTHHPSSSAPALLDPTSPCLQVHWTVLKPRRLLDRTVGETLGN